MNLHLWYQSIPLNIDPIAFTIGFFSIRWYSIMYLLSFLTVLLLIAYRIKRREGEHICKEKKRLFSDSLDIMLVAFLGALIGGRLGYVLLYDFAFFFSNPFAIVVPQKIGQGLFGMSFFGGVIGSISLSFLFAKKRKLNFMQLADFIIPAIPLGYAWGRIGNFINGELYGNTTKSPLGMYFTNKTELRHPSQIYEAILEGILLFVVLWIFRNKFKKGEVLLFFILGYGIARLFSEFFRYPEESDLLFSTITKGQILSLLAIGIAGTFIWRKIYTKNV